MQLEWGTVVENINWTWVINLINFGILLWLLKRFLFRPASEWLEGRRNMEQQRLKRAKEAEAKGQAQLRQREEALADANRRAREIVSQAESEAQQLVRQARDDARRQAHQIVEGGEDEARRIKEEALAELRESYAQLVIQGAGSVLRREVRPEDHRALLEELGRELPERLLS
ncbi:MAG: F0F1 ATP synthase subunit B [Candidatus Bipolaricaulota bacterium]